MKIEVGSEWVNDTDESLEYLVLDAGDGSPVNYEVYHNTKFVGQAESSKELFLLTKSPIDNIKEQAYEEGYVEGYNQHEYEMHQVMSERELYLKAQAYEYGYDSGRNQWQDEHGFTVPDNTVQSLKKAAYAKGLKEGKEFNKDDQNLNYRVGYNDGWHDCEASFELGNDFTDSIQAQAYDEGYDQAIDDLIEAGVIEESDEYYSDEDCSEECYSEYEFGDVEDGEEEYCFSKELDKILNGAFVVDNKSVDNNKEDLVNNPSHYNSDPSGVKCIEITRHRNNNIGNVIKYVWRNGLKDGNSDVQDLEKAAWYLNDEIQRLKGI